MVYSNIFVYLILFDGTLMGMHMVWGYPPSNFLLVFSFFMNQQIRPTFNVDVSTVCNEILADYKKIYKLQIL